jgi:hypothetical protein
MPKMKNEKKEALKKNFLESLTKNMGIIGNACKAANVSVSSIWEWRKVDKEFDAAVNEAETRQIDFVETKLFQRINDGDIAAIIFFLKTKGKKRGYTEKIEVDVSGEITHNIVGMIIENE